MDEIAIDDAGAWANNVCYLTKEFNGTTYIAITLFDVEGSGLVAIIYSNLDDGDEFDTWANVHEIVEKAKSDHPTATLGAMLVLSKDMPNATLVAGQLGGIGEFSDIETLGVIATDGIKWHNIIDDSNGVVDRATITDFQLDVMTSDEPFIDYKV